MPISSDDTIRGRLHLENIKKIKINDKIFSGILNDEKDFAHIEFEAERIYWEPVPDLVDPFW